MSRVEPHDAVELAARFQNPEATLGPTPIWWWSGATITRERLRWQMEQMTSHGICQAVVMCLAPTGPLFGSLADDPPFMSEPWWTLFTQACADAETLGFNIWVYDQIGFSGANIQGRLIADHPEFTGRILRRTTATSDTPGEELSVTAPPGDTPLAAYVVLTTDDPPRTSRFLPVPIAGRTATWHGQPATLVVAHSGPSGFDYFSRPACAALIDAVHGEFERRAGEWFGRSIGGFFQDELPATPTWGGDFDGSFRDAYGYSITERPWALFDDDDAPESLRARRDYQEHRATLAEKALFEPMAAWFTQHGLICGFDQPTPAREGDPVGGVALYGNYLSTHSGYGAPGSDHWGDSKVHSSLAHAHGHDRTWIEAFHSTGWGGTLEETYDWLAPFLRRGATLYNPHAVYYSTHGGWWEWAPPSTCWRQPYWPSYDVFATAVARLCAVLTSGVHVCNTVLLSPTTTSQAYLLADGPLPQAATAARTYHELNGSNSFPAERRGILELAGIDYDILDEAVIAGSDQSNGRLHIGRESYVNVVVPHARAIHTATAARLLQFAHVGGTVICVAEPPTVFLDATGSNETVADRFAAAVRAGRIRVAATAEDVPAYIAPDDVTVEADVPFVVRRVGDVHIIVLTAHDERSGTRQPLTESFSLDWSSIGFDWEEYWRHLHTTGYDFRPVGDRIARVTVSGVSGVRVQRWSPRTGHRVDLSMDDSDGRTTLDVAFDDGLMAVLVIGADLPPASAREVGPTERIVEISGPWTGLATSTLDNTVGDLAGPDQPGMLPVQVWRFDHSTSSDPGDNEWSPQVASFGVFGEVRGPWAGSNPPRELAWTPATWSLTRGIINDPHHTGPLGPKGYVPEEFLDWRQVARGETVAVRTHLVVSTEQRWLAVGSGAFRDVLVDGVSTSAEGDGYLSFTRLPGGSEARLHEIEIRLTANRDGPLRASFALVRDRAGYIRPEWIFGDDDAFPGRMTTVFYEFELDDLPSDCHVNVGSDGPTSVLVNGALLGRQADFAPYPGHREVRVHAYDLRQHLRPGRNRLELLLTDSDRTATAGTVDSAAASAGGLGLTSSSNWFTGDGDAKRPVHLRPYQPQDPRMVCRTVRPHPLSGASWLEAGAAPGSVVEPAIPDVRPGPPRQERLRFAAPVGLAAFTVPSSVPFTAAVGDNVYTPQRNRIELDDVPPPGTAITLTFDAADGRRGGALLDGPVSVELIRSKIPLIAWDEMGLANLGGEVSYQTQVTIDPLPLGLDVILDLGDVRGTADVLVNGQLADRLIWSPWRADVTSLLKPGPNDVEVIVRGTLAGYLRDASPTMGIASNQIRSGLFGPVRLRYHRPHGHRDQ